MAIDADLQRFIDQTLRDFPLPRDPEDLRAFEQRYADASAALPKIDRPVTAVDFQLTAPEKKLLARLYRPDAVKQPPLLVWFHGGGWCAGNLDTHDGLCRDLSFELGVAVASVHINGASEQGLLQGCDDALHAAQALLGARRRLKLDTQHFFIGGDGSGAHLALQAAWRLQRVQPAAVDAVLALYPLCKPDFNTGSYIRNARAPLFSRGDAVRAWQGLLQGRWDTWDERAVLMHGNTPLERAPVVVLVGAEFDVVHDDAIALHDWLRASSVRVEFFGAPLMPHDFVRMQHASPLAAQLTSDILAAFNDLSGLNAIRSRPL